MGKRKKKTINILTAFFISIKTGIISFLKWIFNRYPKGIHWHDPNLVQEEGMEMNEKNNFRIFFNSLI